MKPPAVSINGLERPERVVWRHFKAINATRNLLYGLVAFVAMAVFCTQGTLAQGAGAGPTTVESQEVIAVVPRSWPPQYSIDENGKPIGGFEITNRENMATRATLWLPLAASQEESERIST